MKYCNNCDIKYDSVVTKCMICQNHLDVIDDKVSVYTFQPYKVEKSTKKNIIKGFTLLNFISILICMFIDYSANKRLDWSLIVTVSNVYLILMVLLILSKIRLSLKILGSLFITTALVVGIGFLTGDYHWALDIFLPFASIAHTVSIAVIIFTRRSKWRDYLSFLFVSIVFNIILILLSILNVTNTNWAVTTSFFFGIFTFLAFALFTPKDLKEEIKRRFHI